MALSSIIAPHLILLTPSHRLNPNPRFLPIPSSRFSKPSAAMTLSSIAPHLSLLTPSHRLNPNHPRFLPIPPFRFSKPIAAIPLLKLPVDLSHPLLNPNHRRFVPIPSSRFPKPRLLARSSAGEAAGHPADEKADSGKEGPLAQERRWLGILVVVLLFDLCCSGFFTDKVFLAVVLLGEIIPSVVIMVYSLILVILSLAIAHTMGTLLIKVSLGKVALPLHIISATQSLFTVLLLATLLGKEKQFAKDMKELRRQMESSHEKKQVEAQTKK